MNLGQNRDEKTLNGILNILSQRAHNEGRWLDIIRTTLFKM